MADRSTQGFEVAPVALGGGSSGRRRRRRLPAIIVLLVAIAVPLAAWIGPRIEVHPNVDLAFNVPPSGPVPSPTPTHRPTPIPTKPLPTVLPEITFGDGPRPSGPIAIDAGGMRILDGATGKLGSPVGPRGDRDAIFAAAGGGWWCVCFNRVSDGTSEATTVTVQRFDRSGRIASSIAIGEYASATTSPDADVYTRFDLEVAPDGRTAYLATGERSADLWIVAIDRIDLVAGGVLGHVDLTTFDMTVAPKPKPSEPPTVYQSYLNGPSLRLSPDGRRLLVWASLDSYSDRSGDVSAVPRAWMIDTDRGAGPADGSIGAVGNLAETFAAQARTCGWSVWLSSDRLVGMCFGSQQDGSGFGTPVRISEFGVDGSEFRHFDMEIPNDSWFTEPILDRANSMLYTWDPSGHVLRRIDFARGRADELTLDRDAGTALPSPAVPALEHRPEWTAMTSDNRLWYTPQFVAEPNGNRLFAIGLVQQDSPSRGYQFRSTGVWVFDVADFGLADHWSAVTAYGSISITRDGAWLMAIGYPLINAAGEETNWQSSLTVIDAADGRAALRLGQLGGQDASIFQVPP